MKGYVHSIEEGSGTEQDASARSCRRRRNRQLVGVMSLKPVKILVLKSRARSVLPGRGRRRQGGA